MLPSLMETVLDPGQDLLFLFGRVRHGGPNILYWGIVYLRSQRIAIAQLADSGKALQLAAASAAYSAAYSATCSATSSGARELCPDP